MMSILYLKILCYVRWLTEMEVYGRERHNMVCAIQIRLWIVSVDMLQLPMARVCKGVTREEYARIETVMCG